MPSINFQERFAADVTSGKKRQTIRPPRTRSILVGDILYLFTGMRTKHCRRLGTARCIGSVDFFISAQGVVCVNGDDLEPDELADLARDDGFGDDVDAFIGWFRSHYGLPWSGDIIKWGKLL